MPSILFVCTANRYRSPIAEACFKRELAKHPDAAGWDVSSAGTWTTDGMPPMPNALKDAQRLGLDIQEHRSRVVTEELIANADLILVMEEGQKEALHQEFFQHREKILLLSEATRGIPFDVPDPVVNPSVGDVVGEICKLIEAGFERVCELASK